MRHRNAKLVAVMIISVLVLSVIRPDIAVASQTGTNSAMPLKTTLQQKGINYEAEYNHYDPQYTTDAILARDFSKFQADGIKYIRLPLYWYNIEGNTQGDYSDSFLNNVKRIITTANEYGIQTMADIHTMWSSDEWCTPTYVIDPYTRLNDELAIARSQEMQDDFVAMFSHAVNYLEGTPGLWCWSINEPWYYPLTLPAPLQNVDQKGNFITLFQRMEGIAHSGGSLFTVCFPSVHSDPSDVTDIFANNWNWDSRIFSTLDFISFTTYLPNNPSLLNDWEAITSSNIQGCVDRGKEVLIAETGSDNSNTAQGIEDYQTILKHLTTLPVEGIFPWMWRSDTDDPKFETPDTGYNLCENATTGISDTCYSVFLDEMAVSPSTH